MDIKLEKINGNSKSAKIGKINVSTGDKVVSNQVLLQLETNKGNSPLKAKGEFTIEEIKISEGQEVSIGDTLFVVTGEIKESKANKLDYFGNMIKGKKEDIETDLLIIGGGPGGYVAAIYAAKHGLNTVLVEKDSLGGTCLNYGCIPTKALVKSAETYRDTILGEKFGFQVNDIVLKMDKVIDRKNKIKGNLGAGIEYLLSKNEVRNIKGEAEFLNEKEVLVKKGKDEYKINAKNIIIATGSKISKVNIEGLDLPFVLNSTSALDNKKLPKSITIIGGGVIGMEFAFIYSNFGVEVNVVEYMDRILPMTDKDVAEEIKRIAKEKNIRVYTSSKVMKVNESEKGEAIVFFENEGKEKYLISENVLVAIGREPNIEGLEIEKTSIELNEKGRGIKVNNKMMTNIPNIYAIGDVNNKMQLAHVASHEGIVAVENIIKKEKEMNYDFVPNVIFTSPEIACVGLGEEECIERKMNIKISKFPFSANGKALTMGEEEGFIKIIKDLEKDKIVGASIIGADASSLISALTIIIKNNIKEEDIVDTIFAHPTTGEVIHESILGLSIGAIHYHE